MDCPACSVPLIVVERQGVEIDYCLTCKGLWFDAEELELLCDALGVDADLPDVAMLPRVRSKEKTRRCPRCGKRMEKVRMRREPPLIVDACARGHGLWFDRGELGQVIASSSRAEEAAGQPVVRFLGEVLSGGSGGGSE